MYLGQQIKALRQRRGWSQADLAAALEAHQKQISGYERDVHRPSLEMLIRLAAVFNVSLDYLVKGEGAEDCAVALGDAALRQRLAALDRLSEADRRTIVEVLDAFILKNRVHELARETTP